MLNQVLIFNNTTSNDKGLLCKGVIEKIIQHAEKYKAEDNTAKDKIKASNSLDNYYYTLRNTISEHNNKDKISEEDKKCIEDKVSEVLQWMENNENAEKERYDEKHKSVEAVATPITTKM